MGRGIALHIPVCVPNISDHREGQHDDTDVMNYVTIHISVRLVMS